MPALVAGASKGEGLGNKFLANIRETDAIAHVVRCFEDENVTHVSDSVDPARDIEVINTELQLADLDSVEKGIHRVRQDHQERRQSCHCGQGCVSRAAAGPYQSEGNPARTFAFTADERALDCESCICLQ